MFVRGQKIEALPYCVCVCVCEYLCLLGLLENRGPPLPRGQKIETLPYAALVVHNCVSEYLLVLGSLGSIMVH